jgi:hypothetical protein
VAAGKQTPLITSIGYEEKVVPEINATSGKEIFLNITITEKISKLEGVTIAASKNKMKATNEFVSAVAHYKLPEKF